MLNNSRGAISTRRLSGAVIALCALWLAGCANRLPTTAGDHLVYRDASGSPTMQIDYPSADFCRKVAAIASRNARCESQSVASNLGARATLMYNPPGLEVEAHYQDVARCRSANSTMAEGVQLATPCAAK
jgi:hypothetical protein